MVFSAHAEVVPKGSTPSKRIDGILRARGGSSTVNFAGLLGVAYSPRTRR